MQATISDIQRFQLEKSIWAAAQDFGTNGSGRQVWASVRPQGSGWVGRSGRHDRVSPG